MSVSLYHTWLLALSNPNEQLNLPSKPLPVDRWGDLCEIADNHGVLPAVLGHARRAVGTYGMDRLITGKDADSSLMQALSQARRRLIGRTALSLSIRNQTREIAFAFKNAGVPGCVLKGADFADHLYPDPSLRHFTDLDLLVPEAAVEDAEATISRLGYVSKEVSMKYQSGYGERSWFRPGRCEGIVEIHWNLVNSPTIRKGVDVAWENLSLEWADAHVGLYRPTAPARLLIAAVHAAASHSFDRLQSLYDVCLAAQRCDSETAKTWLSETAKQTGAMLALTVALGLCSRLFSDPSCARLQSAVGLPRRGAWSMLLTPGVVLRGHWNLDSFRRQIFRQMLKRR